MTTSEARETPTPRDVRRVITGSMETKRLIWDIVEYKASRGHDWDTPIYLNELLKELRPPWNELTHLNWLIEGRSGTGQPREGSTAEDDTGFFLIWGTDDELYITPKLLATLR